ncbi:hypothetical protein FHX42_000545 [Saccharopolyspora lacisalsi]|uniref:Uncharacterized protein n=1 Tax=Halosaccharopolyspora lacisalsi TaxID=1000566 RepID=A0A839DSG9_9PSEU|nr:hypothetical protein [Halosaccharopolyspora lacisalsi]
MSVRSDNVLDVHESGADQSAQISRFGGGVSTLLRSRCLVMTKLGAELAGGQSVPACGDLWVTMSAKQEPPVGRRADGKPPAPAVGGSQA